MKRKSISVGGFAGMCDLVFVSRVPRIKCSPLLTPIGSVSCGLLASTENSSPDTRVAVEVAINSLPEGVVNEFRKNYAMATEVRLHRKSSLIFSGPLTSWRLRADVLTIKARGLQSYLDCMAVVSDIRYVNVDQYSICADLINRWQRLEFGNFGIDTSRVPPGGVKRSVTFRSDQHLRVGDAIKELAAYGVGFDVSVDHSSRELKFATTGY